MPFNCDLRPWVNEEINTEINTIRLMAEIGDSDESVIAANRLVVDSGSVFIEQLEGFML